METDDGDLDCLSLAKRQKLPPSAPRSRPPPPRPPEDRHTDGAVARASFSVANSQEWPGLPRGVQFNPDDRDLLWHLLAKVGKGRALPHPFINEFIVNLDNMEELNHTHPQKLPGVKSDGSPSFFFHRTFKTCASQSEKYQGLQDNYAFHDLCWHKIGKTEYLTADGGFRGYKKTMGLFTCNKKGENPEETNWVMHQYHLGGREDDEDEYVLSKVFYQERSTNVDEISVGMTLKTAEPSVSDAEPLITCKPADTELHVKKQHLDAHIAMNFPSQGIFIDHNLKSVRSSTCGHTDVTEQNATEDNSSVHHNRSHHIPSSQVDCSISGRDSGLLQPSDLLNHAVEVKVEISNHITSDCMELGGRCPASIGTVTGESDNDELDHVSLLERRNMLLSSIHSSSKSLGKKVESTNAKDFLSLLQDISSGPSLHNDDDDERLEREIHLSCSRPWRECCIDNVSEISAVNTTNNTNFVSHCASSLTHDKCSSESVIGQSNFPDSFRGEYSQEGYIASSRCEAPGFAFSAQMIQSKIEFSDEDISYKISEANVSVQLGADGSTLVDNTLAIMPCFSEEKSCPNDHQISNKKLKIKKVNHEGTIHEPFMCSQISSPNIDGKYDSNNLHDSVPLVADVVIKAESYDQSDTDIVPGTKFLKTLSPTIIGDSMEAIGLHYSLNDHTLKDNILHRGSTSQNDISNGRICSEADNMSAHLSPLRASAHVKSELLEGCIPNSSGNTMPIQENDVSFVDSKTEHLTGISGNCASKVVFESDGDGIMNRSNQIAPDNQAGEPMSSDDAQSNRFSLRKKRKKTATNSVETALEEDAPGLLQVLLDKGITVDEIKLYGPSEDDEVIDASLVDDSFEELESVMAKLFSARTSLLKLSVARHMKGSKALYCLACLISLIEQTRYLQFRSSPVEWGWCRDLQSFVFVFRSHNRIVLERPEYGYATYFFELVDTLPVDWQIRRLVTAMKLISCSRTSLIENKPFVVGQDLTEGEARVLEEYGWTPNCGLGTMLNYCDRVVHDKKSERYSSEWRAKIGRLLMDGHDAGKTVLFKLPKKAASYISNRPDHDPEIKLET